MNTDHPTDSASGPLAESHRVLRNTRAWVEGAVVGLNLCPFAKAPMIKGQIRYVHSAAHDETALLDALCDEIQALVDADPAVVETTLLIHPDVLGDFEAFNDFLDLAEAAVDSMGAAGVLQIASFHPRYRFAGTGEDDIGNATNRAPYPTLQLLREDSVEHAVEAFPEADAIFEANISRLEALGPEEWAALEAGWRADNNEPG